MPPPPSERRKDRGAAGRIDRPARREDLARLPDDWRPVFLIFVDTEEEFDWSRPQRRENTSTTHVPAIGEGQRRLAQAGARPTYLVDWPIIDDPVARDLLGGFAAAGEASIGLHLHPWVNPPFDEDVHQYNSFAGNLPPVLEEAKIRRLRDRVASAFSSDALCYRAGRYGVGPNTAAILERLGLKVDCSARSAFSYRGEGGPDFSGHGAKPWWVGPNRQLLELPLGVAHLGLLARRGPRGLRRAGEGPLRGLMARTGLFHRIPLTPEGTRPHEAVAAIDRLVADGAPILSFSFHSPSLEPGHTPYVRDRADLLAFWRWWDAALGRLAFHGVAGSTVAEVFQAAESARGAAA